MQPQQPQQVQTQYDSKAQYERVVPHLFQGEALYFVFDLKGAGTGFIGITDRRIIFVDQDFLDRKDMALVTVPYARISFVAVQTERKRFGRDDSSITVAVTGKTFEFEFHGVQKAMQAANAITFHICK
jgi:hypothetical protein